MKKVALTVAVLALGLAACDTKTENAVENTAVENAVEADVNAADDRRRQCCRQRARRAGNAVENAGEAVENAGEAVDERGRERH